MDLLIEYLLTEVALSGETGASNAELQQCIKLFCSISNSSNTNFYNGVVGSYYDHNVDKPFLSHVWKWLTKHKDIRIVKKMQRSDRNLPQIEVHNTTLNTTDTAGTVHATQHRSNRSNLDLVISPTASETPRICTSEEQTWLSVAGHKKDLSKIQALDFICLSIIATQRENGILQPMLVKQTGQDPRSLPSRTQRLRDAGYVVKMPAIMANGSRTSVLALKRFTSAVKAQSNLPSEEETETAPPEGLYNHECKGLQTGIWGLFEQLKASWKVSWTLFRHQLEAQRIAEELQVFHWYLECLQDLGCVQLQLTRASCPFLGQPTPGFVTYLRMPTQMEWRSVFAAGDCGVLKSPECSKENGNTQNRTRSTAHQNIHAERQLMGVDPRQWKAAGNIAQAKEMSQKNEFRTAWDPDRLLSNVILGVVDSSEVNGLTLLDLREQIVGRFYQKPIEHQMSRLVDFWQLSQPVHLRQLSLIRDTVQVGRTSMYVHLTQNHFQSLVDLGCRSWESVRTIAETQTASLETDAYGFPDFDGLQSQTPRSAASLAKSSQGRFVIAQTPAKLASLIGDTDPPLAVKTSVYRSCHELRKDPAKFTREIITGQETPKMARGRPRKYPRISQPADLKSLEEDVLKRTLMSQQRAKQYDRPKLDRMPCGPTDSESMNNVGKARTSSNSRKPQATGIYQAIESIQKVSNSSVIRARLAKVTNVRSYTYPLEGCQYLPSLGAHSSCFQSRGFDMETSKLISCEPAAPSIRKPMSHYFPSLFAHCMLDGSQYPAFNYVTEHKNGESSATRCIDSSLPNASETPYFQHQSDGHNICCQDLLCEQPRNEIQELGPLLRPTKTPAYITGRREQAETIIRSSARLLVGNTYILKANGVQEHDGRSKLIIFRFPCLSSLLASFLAMPTTSTVSNPKNINEQRVEQQFQSVLNDFSSRARGMEWKDLSSLDQSSRSIPPLKCLISGKEVSSASKSIELQNAINDGPREAESSTGRLTAETNRARPVAGTAYIGHDGLIAGHSANTNAVGYEEVTDKAAILLKENSPFAQKAANYEGKGGSQLPAILNHKFDSHKSVATTSKILTNSLANPEPTHISPSRHLSTIERHEASKRTSLLRMRPSGGSVAAQRRQVILDIVQKSGGLFPGDNELWFPFATIWMARAQGLKPDGRTIRSAKKSLIDSGKLRQYKFNYQSKAGITVVKSIITLANIPPEDDRVKSLQARIIAEDPRYYFPEGVEISSGLKKLPTTPDIPPSEIGSKSKERKGTQDESIPKTIASNLMLKSRNQVQRKGHHHNEYATPGHAAGWEHAAATFGSHIGGINVPMSSETPSALDATIPFGAFHYSQETEVQIIEPATSCHRSQNANSSSLTRKYGSEIEIGMTTQLEAPPMLIQKGALEYSRTSSVLISGEPDRGLGQDHVAQKLDRTRISNSKAGGKIDSGTQQDLLQQSDLRRVHEDWSPIFSPLEKNFALEKNHDSPNRTHRKPIKLRGQRTESFEPHTGLPGFQSGRRMGINIDKELNCLHNIQSSRQSFDSSLSPVKNILLTSPGVGTGITTSKDTESLFNQKNIKRKALQEAAEPRKITKTLRVYRSVSMVDNAAPGKASRKDPRSRASTEWNQFNQMAKNILIAILIIRTITGGVRQIINWNLVAMMMASKYSIENIRRMWPLVHHLYRNRITEMQREFQGMFTRAYQDRRIPSIDFNSIESYDWGWLHGWTMKRLLPSASQALMVPHYRKLRRAFRFHENSRFDITDYYESIGKVTVPRRHFILHKHAFVLAYKCPKTNREPLRVIDVAKSWVRGNVVTPEGSYDPEYARGKLLSLGNENVNAAVRALRNSRCIAQDSKGSVNCGRVYSLSESFLSRLKVCLDIDHLLQGIDYKRDIDQRFSAGDEVVFNEDVNDGMMLAIVNLLAEKQVSVRQQRVPANKLGLVGNGYLTRKMDKARLYFDLKLLPSGEYQKIGSPRAVPEPPCAKTQLTVASCDLTMLPLWYDINGNLVPNLWDSVRIAVQTIVALRPGITTGKIRATLQNSLELFEIDLVKDWLLAADLSECPNSKRNAMRMKERWWMFLRPAEQQSRSK